MQQVVYDLTERELELVFFYREFKEWFSGLSAPARRTLAALPRETRLLLARQAVQHRLVHSVVEGVFVPGTVVVHDRRLVAA